jgi:hypothetical protein
MTLSPWAAQWPRLLLAALAALLSTGDGVSLRAASRQEDRSLGRWSLLEMQASAQEAQEQWILEAQANAQDSHEQAGLLEVPAGAQESQHQASLLETQARAREAHEKAAAQGAEQSTDLWVEYPGWGTLSAYSAVLVYPCNVDGFVPTLASGQGYYTDPGVPGGLCRSVDVGNVDMLRQEVGTSSWTITGAEKTVLPALTPSPTISPGTPTSSPTPSPTSFWAEFPGWGSLDYYSDPAVYPCNVDEFVANLAAGVGYYIDTAVPDGWCRVVAEVEAVRQQVGTTEWTSSNTGSTYLPRLTSSPTYAPTPMPTPYPTPAPTPAPTPLPTSQPTTSPTAAEYWIEYAGWGTLDYYNDAVHPCNVTEFATALPAGTGYYYDSAVQGGWCRRIDAGNVELLRQEVGTSAWTDTITGNRQESGALAWTDAITGMTVLPTLPSSPIPTGAPTPIPTSYPTTSPTLEGWVEFPGWGTLEYYNDPPTFPCNVADFFTTLADGMGYYYDPNVPGGLCRSISVDNVDLLRQENGTSAWTDQNYSSAGTDHISGSTYLPALATPAPTAPTPAPTTYPAAANMVDYAGWGTVSSFYGPEEIPCNVDEFVATLAAGMGFYYDLGVEGGLCRRIGADNVELLRQELGTSRWTHHGTGRTYLPTLTPSPTASPTAAPTAAAPAAAGGSGPLSVSGTGDPHLVNVHGQRFDLYQPGVHPLVRIPRSAGRKSALLVAARATRLGDGCKELYFTEVNVTGTWSRGRRNLTWAAGDTEPGRPRWRMFRQVGVKVVHGRTLLGTRYLNVLVRGLNKANYAIGGLLGEDDHTAAGTPGADCASKLTTL